MRIPLLDEDEEPPPRRVRIRKLRVVGVLLGLGILAVVSTVFGMMMAITYDLPRLEEQSGRNSVLTDRNGKPLGLLTGNQKRIFLKSEEIAPVMKQAIIAIEDRRFYTNAGIDIRGIGRALWQDVRAQDAVQGGSTITMQFVKNALAAQDERTLFNKLREAALAYQITRKWSKERILRNYLNTIYFGNGAYGIESAARTYFGSNHPGCGEDGNPKCAQVLAPEEAALIAGMVASPSGYDPLRTQGGRGAAPRAGAAADDRAGVHHRGPAAGGALALAADAPRHPAPARGHGLPLLHVVGQAAGRRQARRRPGGRAQGVRGRPDRADLARRPAPGGRAAGRRLVAALQGRPARLARRDRQHQRRGARDGRRGRLLDQPFNLATQGQRQPGSSFKPFVLAEALTDGVSPDSTWESRKMSHCVTKNRKGDCTEAFEVNNYEDAYGGIRTLRTATTYSDNAVYAQVGIKVGTRKIARLARRMGVRTPVSHNFAMTLGGLKQGVTPLDMAHAYQTLAERGRLVWSTMSPGATDRRELKQRVPGPAGIRLIGRKDGDKLKPIKLPNGERAEGAREDWPVLKASVADDVSSMLSTVVAQGTATRAQIPDTFVAGKTGTTENYGDAWFVGWTDKITVAVWVGYPDELRPMETEFNGQPVAGGTYPAAIWKSFVERALSYKEYGADEAEDTEDDDAPITPAPTTPSTPGAAPETEAPAPDTTAPEGDGGGEPPADPAPQDTAPDTAPPAPEQPPAEPEPPPAQQAPPPSGGTTAPQG